MAYRRILTIQDISCLGQCSMTVALPILSACGHEVCILPAALLSTHTGGFTNPAIMNLSERMDAIWCHWKREGISFDAIYTGYLGSEGAVETAERIMDELLAPGGKIIVDPAMADHGKLYRGLSESYAKAIERLCLRADVMLPNITEAALMTGMAYQEEINEEYILQLLEKLGGNEVVLTGAALKPGMTGAAIRCNGEVSFYLHEKLDCSYSGTGDMFASAFTGAYLQNKNLAEAVKIAADYTSLSVRNTYENPAHRYGVKFETALGDLIEMLK